MLPTTIPLRWLAAVCLLAALAGCSPPAASPPAPTAAATETPAMSTAPTAAPSAAPTARSLKADQEYRTRLMTDYLANLPADQGKISAEELASASAFLVDVREPAEYARGFIEGAVNIPLRTLTRHLDALPAFDQPIVLICGSGHRSAVGMAVLQILGYQNVRSLVGGLGAWKQANLPVVTEPAPKLGTGTTPNVDADKLAALDKYLREKLPQDYGMAPAKDMAAAMKAALLALPPSVIDVRPPALYASGNISGSVNLALNSLLDNLDKIPFTQDTSD